MKRVYLLVFSLFATVAAVLLAWQFRSVVLTFVAALALGAAIRPLAAWLNERGLPRSPATMIVVLLVFTALLGFLGLTGYALAEELPQALLSLQTRYAQIRSDWGEGLAWQQDLAARLPAPEGVEDLIARFQLGNEDPAPEAALDDVINQAVVEAVEAAVAEATPAPGAESSAQPGSVTPVVPAIATALPLVAPSAAEATPAVTVAEQEIRRERRALGLLQVILGTTGSLAGLVAQFLILMVLSLYWSLEHEWFERLWISLLPAASRQRARLTWRAVETGVGAHIRSELLQSALAAVLLFLAFWLIGVPHALLLAWACALLWLIPLVGGLMALLPVAVIGLLGGPVVAIAAAAATLGVYALLEFVIEPRVDVRRRAGSIIGLLVAMIMFDAFGILGLLVASPLATVMDIVVANLWAPGERSASAEEANLERVQEQLAQVRAAIGGSEAEIPPRTRSLYERLQELVAEAEQHG